MRATTRGGSGRTASASASASGGSSGGRGGGCEHARILDGAISEEGVAAARPLVNEALLAVGGKGSLLN